MRSIQKHTFYLKSWSAFSFGASKLSEKMSEAGKKLSEVATLKSTEVYGTVSERVSSYVSNATVSHYMFC